jgi:tRNA-dihydrouridine synthase
MVGRAAIGAPWIFRELKGGQPLSAHEQFALLRRQILESVERIDPIRGILHIRRHLAITPLFKGIPNFKPRRIEILQANSLDTLLQLIDQVEHDFYQN